MNDTFSIAGAGSFREYFARLFEFDHHADGLVLEAFVELGAALPQKSLERICHMVAA